jgi:MoaA/NifB/PqqE/SkfB family radical SAM enzyme
MAIGTYVWEEKNITKVKINTIQINIGNRCNQTCAHCHIDASPRGNKNMDYETARKILDKLLTLDIDNIEFTGGTPELNPNLKMFIEELSQNGRTITVRTSLTVLNLPEYSFFIDLYKKHNVNLIASLPSVFEECF